VWVQNLPKIAIFLLLPVMEEVNGKKENNKQVPTNKHGRNEENK
jgi:hypothetical protein